MGAVAELVSIAFGKGDQTKTEAFRIPAVAIPEDEAEQKVFFREIFLTNSVQYSFSYIRGGGKEFIFRKSKLSRPLKFLT